MSGTVDPSKLSHEIHRLIFHGVDVLEALAAGMFCLSGMARGAIEPIGPERAEEMVTRYDKISHQAAEALVSYERRVIDKSEFEEIHQLDEDTRSELVALLSGQIDWRDRALRREDREERDACVLGQYESLVRKLCGPVSPDPSHLAHLVDGLQGSVESAALQRDEQAAFALMLLEHLRRLPRHEMNEGIENAHHAVCASPRTAESEERSIALLEAQVSIRVLAKLEEHVEYGRQLQALVEKQTEAHHYQVKSLENELVEARISGSRLMLLGALGGMLVPTLVYGVVRLLS